MGWCVGCIHTIGGTECVLFLDAVVETCVGWHGCGGLSLWSFFEHLTVTLRNEIWSPWHLKNKTDTLFKLNNKKLKYIYGYLVLLRSFKKEHFRSTSGKIPIKILYFRKIWFRSKLHLIWRGAFFEIKYSLIL